MKKDIFQVISGTVILAVLMDIIFVVIGKFDLTVLYGTLLGVVCASANFALLALTLSFALRKGKAASGYIGLSYILRLFFIGVVVVLAIKSPYFNYIPTVITLLFPRVIITLVQGIIKWCKKNPTEGESELGRS